MRHVKLQATWNGHRDCASCAMRSSALFSGLTEQDFALIQEPIDDLTFAEDAVVYHMGSPADAVFTLRSGLVKLVRYSPEGEGRIVRLLRPGDLLGLEAVAGERYDHTAISLTPAQVCKIPRTVIMRLNNETTRLLPRLFELWQSIVRKADAWTTDLGSSQVSAATRAARVLRKLRFEDDPSRIVRISLEDMGAILGMAPETASRALGVLKRDGVLQKGTTRKYWRCDPAALDAAAEGEKTAVDEA